MWWALVVGSALATWPPGRETLLSFPPTLSPTGGLWYLDGDLRPSVEDQTTGLSPAVRVDDYPGNLYFLRPLTRWEIGHTYEVRRSGIPVHTFEVTDIAMDPATPPVPSRRTIVGEFSAGEDCLDHFEFVEYTDFGCVGDMAVRVVGFGSDEPGTPRDWGPGAEVEIVRQDPEELRVPYELVRDSTRVWFGSLGHEGDFSGWVSDEVAMVEPYTTREDTRDECGFEPWSVGKPYDNDLCDPAPSPTWKGGPPNRDFGCAVGGSSPWSGWWLPLAWITWRRRPSRSRESAAAAFRPPKPGTRRG